MSVESPEYLELQEKAAAQPIKLVTAMSGMDGENQGGLPLSREQIITLNRYANYVLALPSSRENLQRWLGYAEIDEPELTLDSLTVMFDALRSHAHSWRPLSDACKKLASELGSRARSIATAGKMIMDECGKINAIGPVQAEWAQITLSAPIALDGKDRAAVKGLADYFNILLEDVRAYAQEVQAVFKLTQTFRDTASYQLIPKVHDKRRAVQRKSSGEEASRLRAQLKEIDDQITVLNGQYDQYVKAALSGLAAGPIGVAITGGIYGSKAEAVRKERNRLQAQRRTVSEQLRVSSALEGRMEELSSFVDALKSRLDDVVVASGHLHTAWGSVESYICASLEKLKLIENHRALAKFVMYFVLFLAQWSKIEAQSQQLSRIFDEASAA